MGRELKRKQAKKNNKTINKEEESLNLKLSTIITLVVSVLVILVVLYYVIAIFITKEIKVSWINNNENTTTKQVENRILAKNTFNQEEDTYYVYFYDFNDSDENIEGAIGGLFDYTIYRVDTSSALNKNYITDTDSNRKATSIEDLKVKSPTFIKVSADKIVSYYEGSSEILDFLN